MNFDWTQCHHPAFHQKSDIFSVQRAFEPRAQILPPSVMERVFMMTS